jgi:hypothetical protein
MPNTTQRGEISALANAKEAETVRQSQKLMSKTKQFTASKRCEKPGKKRQNTEEPISGPYGMTPVSSANGKRPAET